MRKLVPLLAIALSLSFVVAIRAGAAPAYDSTRKVHIPDEDRFLPYAVVIHAGDSVQWQNGDSDDHTVVSDDMFNTAGHQGTNAVLEPHHKFSLTFDQPGTFVYYCRLHARLDAFGQPVAPGPDGGIEDGNGNFGTPMTGVVTVLP